jgi:hypothetical protein
MFQRAEKFVWKYEKNKTILIKTFILKILSDTGRQHTV